MKDSLLSPERHAAMNEELQTRLGEILSRYEVASKGDESENGYYTAKAGGIQEGINAISTNKQITVTELMALQRVASGDDEKPTSEDIGHDEGLNAAIHVLREIRGKYGVIVQEPEMEKF